MVSKFDGTGNTQNASASSDTLTGSAASSSKDISPWLYTILMETISYATISVSVFGMTGNISIICAYAKIGFTESINISYCALAISDALSIPFITWHAICYLPVSRNWTRYLEIPTGGAPAGAYFLTTAWLTAFISLERCLSCFHLKSKLL